MTSFEKQEALPFLAEDFPHAVQIPWDEATMREIPNPDSIALSTDPEAAVEYAELRSIVQQQLDTLSPPAAGILKKLHGLDADGKTYTYEEAANAHCRTVHGARIIAACALRRLRNHILPNSLRQYVATDTVVESTPKPSKCEDVFSGIIVPVYDEYDPRPYNVRLKEICDKWLNDQLVAPKKYISGHVHRQITTSLIPDGLYVHDRQINNVEAADEHYAYALSKINSITRSLKFLMYYDQPHVRTTTLDNLLARGTLTIEDLPYVLDINVSDPCVRDAAVAKHMRMTIPEIVAQLAAVKTAYNSYRRRITNNPEYFWKSDLPRVTKLYSWDKLFALGLHREDASCTTELNALRRAKERILRRPAVPGTEQSKAASLIVLETKMAYYERIALIYGAHNDDPRLCALLPDYD